MIILTVAHSVVTVAQSGDCCTVRGCCNRVVTVHILVTVAQGVTTVAHSDDCCTRCGDYCKECAKSVGLLHKVW